MLHLAESAATDTLTAAVPRPAGKLAIVGFWEVTRDLAPYADPAWSIWSCNHAFPYLGKDAAGNPRWDRWIDIHEPAWSAKHLKASVWADMEAFLKTRHGKPIYMQRHYPEYPDSVPFPIEAVTAKLGVNRLFFEADGTQRIERQGYWTSAVAYLLGLALCEGVEEIQVYGADMRHSEESASQRPCVERLLGIAEGMGVKVAIPDAAGLLNSGGVDYGYAEESGAWVEVLRATEDRIRITTAERDKRLFEMHAFDGAIQESEDMKRRVLQRMRGGGVL